jgi:hypothetical protein
VCVDSVGLGELYLSSADKYGSFPKAFLDQARQVFISDNRAIPERAARSGGSDYWAFHERDIPCLFLSDSPNNVRHTTIDVVESIQISVLARLATVLSSKKLRS